MVDPRVCPPKRDIELAYVVRQFGPQYAAQHGDRMMPSHKKALSDIAACCTRELGGRLYCCDTAMTRFGATTAAGTAPAPICAILQISSRACARQRTVPCQNSPCIPNLCHFGSFF